MPEPPVLLVIGGPNGGGKSTIAPALVHDLFGLDEFVNADVIARGLSGFEPAHAAVRAGRIMLERLSELADQRASFAFESTLASRSFAPRIERMIAAGYQFNLAYVWVPTPEVSIARVAARVRAGGHFVPDDEVRRRHERSVRNFFDLYQPLAHTWRFYLNLDGVEYRVLAEGSHRRAESVYHETAWNEIVRRYCNDDRTSA